MHLTPGQAWRQLPPPAHGGQESRSPVKKGGRHVEGKHRRYATRSRSLDVGQAPKPKADAKERPVPAPVPQAEAAEPVPPTPLEVLQLVEKEKRRTTVEHEASAWKFVLQFDEQRQLQIFEDELHWTRGIPGRTLRKARWASLEAPGDDFADLDEEYLNAYNGIATGPLNDSAEIDGKGQGPPPMVEPPPFVRKPINFPKRVFEYKAMLQNQLDIRHHMGEEAIRQNNWRRIMTEHQMRRGRLPQHLLLPRNRTASMVPTPVTFPASLPLSTPTTLPGSEGSFGSLESAADIRLAAYWSAKARELCRLEGGRRWYCAAEERDEVQQHLDDLWGAIRDVVVQEEDTAWLRIVEDAAAVLPPPVPVAAQERPEPAPVVVDAVEVPLPVPEASPPEAPGARAEAPPPPEAPVPTDVPPLSLRVPQLAIHPVQAIPETQPSPEWRPSPTAPGGGAGSSRNSSPMFSDRSAIAQRWPRTRSWEGDVREGERRLRSDGFPRRQLSLSYGSDNDWDEDGSPSGQFSAFRHRSGDDEWSMRSGHSSPQSDAEERLRAKRLAQLDRELRRMQQAEVTCRQEMWAEEEQVAKDMWKTFQRARMALRMQSVSRDRPLSSASRSGTPPLRASNFVNLPPPALHCATRPVAERRPNTTPALSVHVRPPKRLGCLAVTAAADDYGDPLNSWPCGPLAAVAAGVLQWTRQGLGASRPPSGLSDALLSQGWSPRRGKALRPPSSSRCSTADLELQKSPLLRVGMELLQDDLSVTTPVKAADSEVGSIGSPSPTHCSSPPKWRCVLPRRGSLRPDSAPMSPNIAWRVKHNAETSPVPMPWRIGGHEVRVAELLTGRPDDCTLWPPRPSSSTGPKPRLPTAAAM